MTPRSLYGALALTMLFAATVAAQGPGPTAKDSTVADSTAPAAQEPARQPKLDAWGAEKNGALAVGELFILNGFVWAMNEYIGGANWTQTNPRAWYNHFVNGWQYDDNLFTTNFIAHPFHGNLYYNAARSNGFNFWASVPFAFMGSFFWECCGESHEPAINDWLNTSIGGASIGEALYRLSSTVLDNTATGGERVRREVAAGLIDPTRGFTRLITGATHKVGPNPTRAEDHIPTKLINSLHLGARYVRDQGPFDEADQYGGLVGLEFQYGDPLNVEKPFDHFRMALEFYTRDKKVLGAWSVRGDLVTSSLQHSDKRDLYIGATLNYEYFNTNAFEFGGQSVTGYLRPRWVLSPTLAFEAQAGLDAQIFGAVNSEFAFLAPVPPGQTRIREYDMGIGGGGNVVLRLAKRGRPMIQTSYRMLYLDVLNGSEGTVIGFGDIDGFHILQHLGISARIPVAKGFGVAADADYFQRHSDWRNSNVANVDQLVRELKLYATWEIGRGIGS